MPINALQIHFTRKLKFQNIEQMEITVNPIKPNINYFKVNLYGLLHEENKNLSN